MDIKNLLNIFEEHKSKILELAEDDGMIGDDSSYNYNMDRYNKLCEFIDKYNAGYMTNVDISSFMFIISINPELKEYRDLILDILQNIDYEYSEKIKTLQNTYNNIHKLYSNLREEVTKNS